MSLTRHTIAMQLAGVVLLAGCTSSVPPPLKSIQVPTGGDPVLTAAERSSQQHENRQPSRIVPASFQRPIDEAPTKLPFKPFEQWTEQDAAADALGRIGTAAVPVLVQALHSQDAEVRLKAAEVLARMGPDAKDAVPALVELLDDPDFAVRKAAARTLGRIGPEAKDAVPALMRFLLQEAPQPPTP